MNSLPQDENPHTSFLQETPPSISQRDLGEKDARAREMRGGGLRTLDGGGGTGYDFHQETEDRAVLGSPPASLMPERRKLGSRGRVRTDRRKQA